MKTPNIVAVGIRDCHNLGLNAFALQLVAESFADDPAKFADNDALICVHAHNGQEVWMVLTKSMPKPSDFADFVHAVNADDELARLTRERDEANERAERAIEVSLRNQADKERMDWLREHVASLGSAPGGMLEYRFHRHYESAVTWGEEFTREIDAAIKRGSDTPQRAENPVQRETTESTDTGRS